MTAPAWLDVLRDVATDPGAPADVAQACAAAVAELDRLADAWAPTPRRWRYTRPGDAFVGEGASLWRITDSRAQGGQWRLDVARAGEPATEYLGDPDETVDVLVPVAERDAALLLREQLGAQLIGRTA